MTALPALAPIELARSFESFAPSASVRVERRFAGRLGAVPVVAALERGLFAGWIAHCHAGLKGRTKGLVASALAAIEISQRMVVTQRQLPGIDILDSHEDDDFLDRSMTLLLSGFGNCELSNLIVYALLRAAGVEVHWFETGMAEELDGSHTLLYAQAREGGAFVDAWSDVPLFQIDGFVPRMPRPRSRWRGAWHRPRRLDGVPEHAELASQLSLVGNGLYPAEALRAGIVRGDAPVASGEAPADAREAAAAGEPVAGVWREYVELRRQHLFGELEHPRRAYTGFSERDDVTGLLLDVVRALARRQPET